MERRAGSSLETRGAGHEKVSRVFGGESAEIRGTQHLFSEVQGEAMSREQA